jgi:hypothetical protein
LATSPGEINNPEVFRREILPLIQNVPLRRLSKGTGLSLRYVSLIRRGERVPHPRHWDASREGFMRWRTVWSPLVSRRAPWRRW